MTTEDFIAKACKIHGKKYNYSKTNYVASDQKVSITCYIHGDFEQIPTTHLSGAGCKRCATQSVKLDSLLARNQKFIENSRKIHGDRYDYKHVIYENNNTHARLMCAQHGLFMQKPSIHVAGGGCKPCADIAKGLARRQRMATGFIERAEKVHSRKYDYSNVIYISSSQKVEIICKKHGIFKITPNSFFRGSGCSKCGTESQAAKQSMNIDTFIACAKNIHGNKYDYSQVIYDSTHKHVIILCSKHGPFFQAPSGHLSGRGCRECGIKKCANNLKNSLEDFLEKAKNIHGNLYDYSQAIYESSNTPLIIICLEHGPFLQKPDKHCSAGHGCPSCANRDIDTTKFISRSQKAHGDKYDYSKSIYTTAKAKVTIICRDHGPFEQCAWNHMEGTGCQLCVDRLNSRGIRFIEAWLNANKISFEREKSFTTLKGKRKNLRFDFFIQEFNLLIEFDGQQHFKPNVFWGGEKAFSKLVENDNRKNAWTKENGYFLLRINFNDEHNIETILESSLKKLIINNHQKTEY